VTVEARPGATLSRRRTFSVGPGLHLVGDETGPSTGDPIVFLHGGGQTRAAWRGAQNALAARGVRNLALDQRGHGESSRAPDYRLSSYADDLAAVLASIGGRPILVGASLGGLTSIIVLGERHAQAGGLVLVDITPKFAPSGAEKIRDFMRARADGFVSLNEAADAVAEYLPHRRRPRNLDGLRKNLVQDGNGRWHWHWDPLFLADDPEVGFRHEEARVRRALSAVKVPILLVRGMQSELISDEAVADFREIRPDAKIAEVNGARHMVAGDDNDIFLRSILDFIKDI